MLIVFALDTSASTAARSVPGLSLLDCAKGAIEHFVKVCVCERDDDRKRGEGRGGLSCFFRRAPPPPFPFQVRSRDPASTADTLALTTCDAASPLAAYDRRPGFPAFHAALRAASPSRATCLGTTLRAAFDVVALVRGATGADTYGAGFTPAMAAPAMVVVVTDGGAVSDAGAPPFSCLPPGAPVPNAGLTLHPYRWDTRLFGVTVRLGGVTPRPTGRPADPAADAATAWK